LKFASDTLSENYRFILLVYNIYSSILFFVNLQ
jgi:hypothetical protein